MSPKAAAPREAQAWVHRQLDALPGFDVEDMDAFQRAAAPLLAALTDRALLYEVLLAVTEDPALLALCEYDPVLNKVVLGDHPSGFRLRLHVFRPGHEDRPHNHRWSFASRVLHGGYEHLLFGPERDFGESSQPGEMHPILVQQVEAGSTYSLHHSLVHSLVARPGSASLIVRAPAVKERMIVMDRRTGEVWWHYGAANDKTAEAKKHARMSAEHLHSLIAALQQEKVL